MIFPKSTITHIRMKTMFSVNANIYINILYLYILKAFFKKNTVNLYLLFLGQLGLEENRTQHDINIYFNIYQAEEY